MSNPEFLGGIERQLEQIRELLAFLIREVESLKQQGATSMAALDDKISQLQSDITTLKADAAANKTTLTTLSTNLATAIANLASAGVTEAQLAALEAIHTDLVGVATGIAADDAAATTPATPAAP